MKIIIHNEAAALGLTSAVAFHISNIKIKIDGQTLAPRFQTEIERLKTSVNEHLSKPQIAGYKKQLEEIGHPEKEPASWRLIRNILDTGFKPILNVVDAYNLAALTHGSSIGVHATENIKNEIIVERAKGGEKIRPLFSSKEKKVAAGDIIYHCDGRLMAVIGKNDRDADDFKITSHCGDVVAIILGNKETTIGYNLKVLEEFVSLLSLSSPDIAARRLEIQFD